MGQIGVNRCFLSLTNGTGLDPVITRLEAQVPDELTPFFLSLTKPVTVGEITRRRAAALLKALGVEAVIPLRSGNELKGVFGVGARGFFFCSRPLGVGLCCRLARAGCFCLGPVGLLVGRASLVERDDRAGDGSCQGERDDGERDPQSAVLAESLPGPFLFGGPLFVP